MPEATELQRVSFQTGLAVGSVNPKGFSDVSILTAGMEAAGHGFYVDETSIQQLMGLLIGKSLPAYLTHAGMSSDRLGEEIGIFSGFYRDGMQLRAKNFTFTDAFMKHNAKEYETVVQLASQFPDQLGVSPVLLHGLAWITQSGLEVDASKSAKPADAVRDIPSIRIGRVKSADLVKTPAANVALFSKKEPSVDGGADGMANTIELEKHAAALAAKEAEVTAALSVTHKTALAEKDAALVAALAVKDTELKTALAAKDKELTDTKAAHVATLAAKDAEIVEIKKFDVRNHGGQGAAAVVTGAGSSSVSALSMPEPAPKDHQRWEQYSELSAKDPKLASEFKAKFIDRK